MSVLLDMPRFSDSPHEIVRFAPIVGKLGQIRATLGLPISLRSDRSSRGLATGGREDVTTPLGDPS